uniref:Uncharacterized protein n=1 Tax=Lotharella globosa TaxID=91324 RepID=A0A7S4E1I6_9EUKA
MKMNRAGQSTSGDPMTGGSDGGSSGSGPLGVPLSTWALLFFILFLVGILCAIGVNLIANLLHLSTHMLHLQIFFLRKYLRAVIRCLEDSICNVLWAIFIFPAQMFCKCARYVTYPVKEMCVGCWRKLDNYYKPYKITS